MLNELHWGGINVKSLFKAVLPNLWMAFAVIVIVYIGLGIAGNKMYTPSYTSSTVVAVYPLDEMNTIEASAQAVDTVSALNEVINSEMFKTGLKDRLDESVDFYLHSQQIRSTYILMLSVSSSSPQNAYQTIRAALDYFNEISSHLVGDSHLEILTEPDFPIAAPNDSKILKYRPLLSLFIGFAMVGFLALIYIIRRTYKTSSAIQNYYKNVRFFRFTPSASEKDSRRKKRKTGSQRNQATLRKTALELLQMLRARNAKSLFITSAAHGEGKTVITESLKKEFEDFGKSVIELKPDMINTQNDFSDLAKEVEDLLERSKDQADVILIDGCIWTGSGDELIWAEAADISLAVCRQDKADFYAIDRMITDLSEKDTGFGGCVLYEF